MPSSADPALVPNAGAYENENLAYQPQYASTVAQLREELHAHWPTTGRPGGAR